MQDATANRRPDSAGEEGAPPGTSPAGPARRYPFLPPDPQLGWTPYVWLVYLAFFLLGPLFAGGGVREWVASLAVVAAFLPLYFLGYWQNGRRVVLVAAAIALLGAVSVPWNFGGSVFFIYAAAFLGYAGPPRVAVRWLLVLLAILGLESWLLSLHPTAWITGLVFSALIGGIGIHDAEVKRRNQALARSHAEIERLAQVAERERIGRDLHDLLGHTLSLVTLKAELAGRLLPRDPAAAAVEIRDVERISRQALREVREAVLGYRAEGLAAEMERAEAALAAAGVACERTVEAVDLDPDTDRALALVLREAVTNVVRHAGARHCHLTLAWEGAGLRLEVADDGRGGGGPEGSGLSGIRERVTALGGRVLRDGAGGTRLTVHLPRRPAARREGRIPASSPLPEEAAG